MAFRLTSRLLKNTVDVHKQSLKNTRDVRKQLLTEIYAPFKNMDDKSPAYMKLAESGLVWENYFKPYDSNGLGYTRLQQECVSTFKEIDSMCESWKRPPKAIARQTIAEYAHQSVMIENNRLSLQDSHEMHEELREVFFEPVKLADLSLDMLLKETFPTLSSFNPKYDREQSIELRNHIIASQWIAETALKYTGHDGLDEASVQKLSAVAMKDLGNREGYYPWSFGPRVRLGEYRQIPIGVHSTPLAVFPYNLEVPACMTRFFQWRAAAHASKTLHPLILACQATIYFLQIHPFTDGNGRVSRMMMHDYMVRQGYLPVYMIDLQRNDYLQMIRDAAAGKPDGFVSAVVTSQLDFLYSYTLEDVAKRNN